MESLMGRFHFTIAGLMAVMIPVAVGLAAFQAASELWVNIVFNLVVAVLLAATYKAKCSRGIAGAWWAGFASFGWANLVLCLIGMPWGQHYGVAPTLVTAEIAWRLVEFLDPDPSPAALQRVMARFLVLHCALSLLISWLGATIFSLFAARGMASEQVHRQLDGDSSSS
jgi:hypothetical protein